MRPTPKTTRGFTLVELVIVITIVAVLAVIAVPSYLSYVIRSNRAQAKQFLADLSNREEQYLLDQRSYTTATGTGGLNTAPPPETVGYYTFAITVAPGNDCLGAALPPVGYVISAVAIGRQASDGDLCLDSLNQRTPSTKWAR
jgi:type IV pilus assembly protein PilE